MISKQILVAGTDGFIVIFDFATLSICLWVQSPWYPDALAASSDSVGSLDFGNM